jgi:hypothetical protein
MAGQGYLDEWRRLGGGRPVYEEESWAAVLLSGVRQRPQGRGLAAQLPHVGIFEDAAQVKARNRRPTTL